MFIYPIYKALKQQLTPIAPAFFYTGQYLAGKGNTVYRVPALYIETPKDSVRTYWGRGIRVIKNSIIKLHYISNAPFNQHDNVVQDSALQAHTNQLININQIMQGLVLYNENGRILTQPFKHAGGSELNFREGHVYSVLMYSTEIYNYSTWEGKPAPPAGEIDINISIR